MNLNKYFKQISNEWINIIYSSNIIMSLIFLILNLCDLFIKYKKKEIILSNIILIILTIAINISLYFISYLIKISKNKNKEYLMIIIYLLINYILIFYHPDFIILLLFPAASMIFISKLNDYKKIFELYLLNIVLIILNFLRINNFTFNNIVQYLLIIVIITFICKLSYEISKIFILSNNYMKKICNRNTSLEKKLEIEPLTKLLNRNALYKNLDAIFNETQKNSIMPCLVMIDLDKFKRINDTYGHINGDKVLIFLSKMLKNKLPKKSLAYRFGGEEFILIIKDLEVNKVYKIIEELRKEFGKIRHRNLNSENMTFSAGIAKYSYKKDITNWVEEADTALYQAKNEGRNKTIIYKR